MSNIHDDEGCYYETIDLVKIKIGGIFPSKKVLLNIMLVIAIKDYFQFQTIKSNRQILVLSCLVDG